jgi:SAM-dependent methyltransferase
MNEVRKYYNDHIKDEDRRLDEHPFEIPVTMHYVAKYLEPGGSIFDVACGTGRIAGLLLEKGYHLGLSDLSDSIDRESARYFGIIILTHQYLLNLKIKQNET